jgi:hypothetical protein
MLKLNLHREPYWLDVALGVRLNLEPLTTAIMVAARTDPSVRSIALGTPDDTIAVAFAKAIAKRAILDWEGVGDLDGAPVSVTPDGVDALLDIWPIFEAFQTAYVAKGLELEAEKTPQRPCRMGLWRGRWLLRQMRRGLPRLPASPKRAAKSRGLAGLGSLATHGRPITRGPARGAGV